MSAAIGGGRPARLRGPPARAPRHPTLVAALAAAARSDAGVTFVDLRERERVLPWREVHARSRAAAARLRAQGVEPGDRVALVLRTEPAFLDAFFGALAAGAVPVPLYPPVRLGRMEEYLASTARMVAVSGARLVVAGGTVRRLLGDVVARTRPALGCLAAEELAAGGGDRAAGGGGAGPEDALAGGAAADPDALALVQFSSGSTVAPKAVALTHRQLTCHCEALLQALSAGPSDACVSWLPLYHDMGLVGALLATLFHPGRLVLIPPDHFLARPALWLRAAARHRATISAAPSFAYAYAAARVRDADLAGQDLSAWRVALDGAEPVSAAAARRFGERFRRHGFDPAALTPVYGLSEASLGVTFAPPGRALATCRVDPVALARSGEVGAGDRELTSVGRPIPGVEVELRGRDGAAVAEGRLGRVHVRGPSVMRGYFGDDEATRRAVRDGWLDTGDLGFVLDGELYLYGRAKDLVIVRGSNHAPEVFEECLAEVPGLRPGCAVALGYAPEEAGGEQLLVLAERARDGDRAGDLALARLAERAILERTGVAPWAVRVLDPGTLPRTSSGKLRRGETLRRFTRGELTPPRAVGAVTLAREVARSALGYARAALSARRGALEASEAAGGRDDGPP